MTAIQPATESHVRKVGGVKLYPVDEVAKMLGVNRKSVLDLIHSQALPAKRIGKGFYISETKLNEFAETPDSDEAVPKCIAKTGLQFKENGVYVVLPNDEGELEVWPATLLVDQDPSNRIPLGLHEVNGYRYYVDEGTGHVMRVAHEDDDEEESSEDGEEEDSNNADAEDSEAEDGEEEDGEEEEDA